MEPAVWIALSLSVLALACTGLLAFLGAPAAAVRALTRTQTLAADVRALDRALDEIRTADLPSVRRACELMLEDCEAILASAEQKRKRASGAQARARGPAADGQMPAEGEQTMDQVLANGDRGASIRALTEHFRGAA